MEKKDLVMYVKKAHVRALNRFVEELEAWRKETEERAAVLYEDAFTSFTLENIHLFDGKLCYVQDGKEYSERIVERDPDDGQYYELEYDGVMEYVKYWRACLRRARRYWQMDVDELDRIQNGEQEDEEDEEED